VDGAFGEGVEQLRVERPVVQVEHQVGDRRPE
jgi:hypothetical protein